MKVKRPSYEMFGAIGALLPPPNPRPFWRCGRAAATPMPFGSVSARTAAASFPVRSAPAVLLGTPSFTRRRMSRSMGVRSHGRCSAPTPCRLLLLEVPDRLGLDCQFGQQAFHLRVVLLRIHRRLPGLKRRNLPLEGVARVHQGPHFRIAGVNLLLA